MPDPATILEVIKRHSLTVLQLDDGRWAAYSDGDFDIERRWYERCVEDDFLIGVTLEEAVTQVAAMLDGDNA